MIKPTISALKNLPPLFHFVGLILLLPYSHYLIVMHVWPIVHLVSRLSKKRTNSISIDINRERTSGENCTRYLLFSPQQLVECIGTRDIHDLINGNSHFLYLRRPTKRYCFFDEYNYNSYPEARLIRS